MRSPNRTFCVLISASVVVSCAGYIPERSRASQGPPVQRGALYADRMDRLARREPTGGVDVAHHSLTARRLVGCVIRDVTDPLFCFQISEGVHSFGAWCASFAETVALLFGCSLHRIGLGWVRLGCFGYSSRVILFCCRDFVIGSRLFRESPSAAEQIHACVFKMLFPGTSWTALKWLRAE